MIVGMDLVSILMIALGLSMDSLAVAVASSFSSSMDGRGAIKLGASFGAFQAGMPVLGWYGGTWLVGLISGFDHWIAFLLLAFIGGRMLYEGIASPEPDRTTGTDALKLGNLLLLSLATSIDALAVGLSLSLLDLDIFLPAAIIGTVCFALSAGGASMGKRLGARIGYRVRIIGGSILVLIGVRILLEHLGVLG